MDFWDLTKLLVRRWMIVLPMLVLSAGLAALTIVQVKPDYVATAYVQLVPPVLGETKPGQATAEQRNPWIGLGLQTIGNAAIVTVTERSVEEQMKALGYSDSYTLALGSSDSSTATWGSPIPMVRFEIVGTSEAQARATANELVERFSQSVGDLQSTYQVARKDAITARRLDLGTNVEASTSKVKRAFAAVLAAGLLLSAACTVGIDAWLRQRQRRRSTGDSKPPAATPNPLPPAATPPPSRTDEREEAQPTVTMRLPATGVPPAATPPPTRKDERGEAQPTVTVRLPATGVPRAGNGDGDGDHAHQPTPSDATIVLRRTRP